MPYQALLLCWAFLPLPRGPFPALDQVYKCDCFSPQMFPFSKQLFHHWTCPVDSTDDGGIFGVCQYLQETGCDHTVWLWIFASPFPLRFFFLLTCIKSTAGHRSLYFFSLLTQLQYLSHLEKQSNWDLKPFPWIEIGYQLVRFNLCIFVDVNIHSIWCIFDGNCIHCSLPLSFDLWVIITDSTRIHNVNRPFFFILQKKVWVMDLQ